MYTVKGSPSFVTVSVMFLAFALRSLTILSMVAWCFRKNGRITRLYRISEPFHVTGAIHHMRNKHCRKSTFSVIIKGRAIHFILIDGTSMQFLADNENERLAAVLEVQSTNVYCD